MSLASEQVKKVAKLANLNLTPEEGERYAEQLSKILDYIGQLNQINTANIEPTFNVTGLNNVMSKDEPRPGLSQEEALSNAPKKKDNMFITKGVFEEE